MLVRLLIVFVLVLLNGFFVGAEFALVRSRRTRLEAMTRGGDTKARLALRALNNLPRLLSATQVGVTLASLGLGWVAESAFGALFEHLLGYLPFAIEVSLRVTLGADVTVTLPGGEAVVGHAVRIDRDGSLVLRTPAGERAISAGDVG